MAKPRIAVIISSTRQARFADKPAAWLMDKVLLEHLEQELGECDDADLKRTLGFEVE